LMIHPFRFIFNLSNSRQITIGLTLEKQAGASSFLAVTAYKVGQWTTIAGQEATSAGNIFFAGDHTSKEFQGYMNGAAESGLRAANDVLLKL